MNTAEETGRTGPRPEIVWLTVGALAFVARFPTLGLQSPWLDEINNWQTATEVGPQLQMRAHTLTYLCENLGLALSDSTWGLRLYSAVIGFVAVLALTQFLLSRFGSRAALMGGSLLALLPYSIHYSQDANHYAPMLLSGVLSAFAVAWFLDRSHAKPWLAACSLAVVGLALGFHPLGLLPALGAGACLISWLFVYASRVPPKSLSPVAKRGAIVGASVAMAAAVLLQRTVRSRLQLGDFGTVEGTRAPGLNWSFWSALLADLLSTPFIHSSLDVFVGLLGVLLAVCGWVWAWRAGYRWAALGAGFVAGATVLPFMVIELGHFFYPKFLAPVVPVLACGIALAAEAAFRAGKGSLLRIGLGGACALWIALLAARELPWHMARIEFNHQPTYQLLAAIREKTPEGTVVATRNIYSSRAMAFLWHRTSMGERRHVALPSDELAAGPAIQQLEELAFESESPTLFTSLLESREHFAPDFDAFLKDGTQVVAHLPSSAPDDFVPFDRSLTVRAVMKPERDPFLLPRSGGRMSGVLEENRTQAVYTDRSVALSLPLGSGARYRFRVDIAAEGLALDYRWDTSGRRPEMMLLVLDGQRVFAIGLEKLEPSGSIRVPAPVAPGQLHTLDLMMANRDQNWSAKQPAGLIPMRLRAATAMDSNLASEAEFLAEEDRPEPERETLPTEAIKAEMPVSGLAMPPVASGETLIAISTMEIGGLANKAVAPVLDVAGQRVGLWHAMPWTQGQVTVGAIFKTKAPAAKMDILLYIRPHVYHQERDPWFVRGNVKLYKLGS